MTEKYIRPPNEKVKPGTRWTSIRLPIPVIHSIRWCARKKRMAIQKFMRFAIDTFIEEVDSGTIDTTFPANRWYDDITDIYGVRVDEALILRAQTAACKLYHSVSGFYALAVIRAISKIVDPENTGITFNRDAIFTTRTHLNT